MNSEQIIQTLEEEYSEWKEELGDQFPSFLNHILASRLMDSKKEIEYLRKISFFEMVK